MRQQAQPQYDLYSSGRSASINSHHKNWELITGQWFVRATTFNRNQNSTEAMNCVCDVCNHQSDMNDMWSSALIHTHTDASARNTRLSLFMRQTIRCYAVADINEPSAITIWSRTTKKTGAKGSVQLASLSVSLSLTINDRHLSTSTVCLVALRRPNLVFSSTIQNRTILGARAAS